MRQERTTKASKDLRRMANFAMLLHSKKHPLPSIFDNSGYFYDPILQIGFNFSGKIEAQASF
jgi:hypothetical protein